MEARNLSFEDIVKIHKEIIKESGGHLGVQNSSPIYYSLEHIINNNIRK